MTRPRRAHRCAIAAAALALASACGFRQGAHGRVIVLGIDGMDYGVTRELMAQGRMPNFSTLAASGAFTPLATSIPPQSPVAWSSFITGLDAGGHGIFDFVHRDPRTMAPYLSTSRSEPARHVLTFAGWQWPLSSARLTLLRDGQPFWDVLERRGIPTTIVRMPANFPPSGLATRELSGMGTPDLIGTYGTFSFFTSSPDPGTPTETTESGGRIYAVDVVDQVVHGALAGPANPFQTSSHPMQAPFTVYLDARHDAAKIVVGAEERVLLAGEWSDWVSIEFPMLPLDRLRGMCRFYLKQVRPEFQMYVSPINIDPRDPAMPLSTPASFAGDLARATGPFYTQGMPADTKALTDHVITRDEFLRQAALVGDEATRQYWAVLDDFRGGLLFYYFGTLDQVSHMLWRARDPGHPAYNASRDAPYRAAIDDLYVAFDRLVGETRRRMGGGTTLVVMSDHGFASWRRTFHLNSWLRDHGYLAAVDPARRPDPGLLQNVDWTRTRAYGLGLNGLYINLAGRERDGIVPTRDRRALIDEIRRALLAAIDPATGLPAITKVYVRDEAFTGTAHDDVAPDMIVGYAKGTRVSNESALGGLTPDVFADNTSEWSGDHCMDPDAVPGILLTSRALTRPATSLDGLAGSILEEFGITGFPAPRSCDGCPRER